MEKIKFDHKDLSIEKRRVDLDHIKSKLPMVVGEELSMVISQSNNLPVVVEPKKPRKKILGLF